MFSNRSKFLLIAAASVGFALGGFSAASLRFDDSVPNPVPSNLQRQFGTADVGGPFSLINQEGKPFTNQDLLGRPSLLIFGRSLDDTLSAAALDVAQDVARTAQLRGIPIRVVFIPLAADPVRVPELKQFLDSFDETIIGLTGDKSSLMVLAQSFRLLAADRGRSADVALQSLRPVVFVMDTNGRYMAHKVMPIRVTEIINLIIKTF